MSTVVLVVVASDGGTLVVHWLGFGES